MVWTEQGKVDVGWLTDLMQQATCFIIGNGTGVIHTWIDHKATIMANMHGIDTTCFVIVLDPNSFLHGQCLGIQTAKNRFLILRIAKEQKFLTVWGPFGMNKFYFAIVKPHS